MVLNIITISLKLISSFTMFYFARPKLMGLPVSVKSFTQFGEVLPINGKTFMYFTGALELLTALILLASVFLGNSKLGNYASIFGYLLLVGAMLGALITEFKIRPEPVSFLVQIAVVLLFIALPQLFFLAKANM